MLLHEKINYAYVELALLMLCWQECLIHKEILLEERKDFGEVTCSSAWQHIDTEPTALTTDSYELQNLLDIAVQFHWWKNEAQWVHL